jgi:hypothetical protein
VRALNIMGEKEAEEVGIPVHERSLYVRVDRGKGNMAPPSRATWIHLANVDLPNGDEVGVVEPWDHPGRGNSHTDAGTALERKAEDVYLLLLRRFASAGLPVSPKSGKSYAPLLFSREREAVDANLGKVPLERAQMRLFAAGRIRSMSEGSGGKRRHWIVEIGG